MEPVDQKISQSVLTRKHFLSLTGKSMAIGAGTLAASGILGNAVNAQTPQHLTSPPATIPPGPADPIVLEAWKSAVDQQSGPMAMDFPVSDKKCLRVSTD